MTPWTQVPAEGDVTVRELADHHPFGGEISPEVFEQVLDAPLDHVKDPEAAVGSYRSLTQSATFRFIRPSRRAEAERGGKEG